MASVVIIVIIFTSTTILATTSRQLFAFSRDKGFPFSRLLAHVRTQFDQQCSRILQTNRTHRSTRASTSQ